MGERRASLLAFYGIATVVVLEGELSSPDDATLVT